MKITSWRIVKTKRADERATLNGVEIPAAFEGIGASLYPGRWNNAGTPIIYTAGSQSLATLEILVHLEDAKLLNSFSIFPVTFNLQDTLIMGKHADGKSILSSEKWQANPPDQDTRNFGDAWVHSSQSLVLAVPSAVIPNEFNYLINPYHNDFSTLEIGKPQAFPFDKRLKY
jgi:RES domain-containing protein